MMYEDDDEGFRDKLGDYGWRKGAKCSELLLNLTGFWLANWPSSSCTVKRSCTSRAWSAVVPNVYVKGWWCSYCQLATFQAVWFTVKQLLKFLVIQGCVSSIAKWRDCSVATKSVRNSYGRNINMDYNLTILFSSSSRRKHNWKKERWIESFKYCKNN